MKNRIFLERLSFAVHGLAAAIRHEKSFRSQLIIAVVTLALLGMLQPELIWWALIGVMIALVLGAELINTSLEHLADHLHPEQHPKIKLVKDCAAAAVLVFSLGAIWVGALAVVSVF
jgi:diacylglycerol kinase (ATP)